MTGSCRFERVLVTRRFQDGSSPEKRFSLQTPIPVPREASSPERALVPNEGSTHQGKLLVLTGGWSPKRRFQPQEKVLITGWGSERKFSSQEKDQEPNKGLESQENVLALKEGTGQQRRIQSREKVLVMIGFHAKY